jgi:ankyrin repeat protein
MKKIWQYQFVEACAKGDLDFAKASLEQGLDVNEPYNGQTPLMSAASSENVELVQFLINQGSEINVIYNDRFTAIGENAKTVNDTVHILKVLLDAGADIHLNRDQIAPVMLSTLCKSYTKVAYLLERGADINDIFNRDWIEYIDFSAAALVSLLGKYDSFISLENKNLQKRKQVS